MTDLVNHPPHYTSHPSGVECITITEHMSFNVGNAVKYLWRADEKGAPIEDLRKAVWYINREIERRCDAESAADMAELNADLDKIDARRKAELAICFGTKGCPSTWHHHGCFADLDGSQCDDSEAHR